MPNYYYYYENKGDIEKINKLISQSDRDVKEMLGVLVEILERKELLTHEDLAAILGVGISDLGKIPF